VDEDNVLDSKKAFVSLSLFNVLRFPLSMLPMIITGLVQANVSTKRINKFMNAEEIKSEVKRELRPADASAGQKAIEVKSASFTWDLNDQPKSVNSKEVGAGDVEKESEDVMSPLMPRQQPAVNDVSFEVQPGGLVAIVGSVGAGKTSILSAILGKMKTIWYHIASLI